MKWRFGILAAVVAVAGCGNGDLQRRTIDALLDEPASEAPGGQFPRFQPILQAGQGPALDVRIVDANVRGGFLLESRRGHIESWLGNDGVGLIFDRGVLHGTRGIGAGLLAADVSPTARAVLAGRSGDVERVHSYLNGNDEAETRAYACTVTNEGSETIQLDTGAVSTRRMAEVCRNLDQEFTNTYWVDTRRGRIVRSVQWTGEDVGALEITTVYDF